LHECGTDVCHEAIRFWSQLVAVPVQAGAPTTERRVNPVGTQKPERQIRLKDFTFAPRLAKTSSNISDPPQELFGAWRSPYGALHLTMQEDFASYWVRMNLQPPGFCTALLR